MPPTVHDDVIFGKYIFLKVKITLVSGSKVKWSKFEMVIARVAEKIGIEEKS